MSSKYTIQQNDGITHIKLYEKVFLETAKVIVDDIVNNHPYEKRLWDLTEFKGDFNITEIQALASYSDPRLYDNCQVAMVASSDVLFGEMRQFKAYADIQELIEVGVFRDLQEALTWLKNS